jgi:hypothetical protein
MLPGRTSRPRHPFCCAGSRVGAPMHAASPFGLMAGSFSVGKCTHGISQIGECGWRNGNHRAAGREQQQQTVVDVIRDFFGGRK